MGERDLNRERKSERVGEMDGGLESERERKSGREATQEREGEG